MSGFRQRPCARLVQCASCALVLTAVLLTPAGVAAQDDLKSDAAELVDKGNRKFRAGDLQTALALYEAAYRVFPSPKLFYNLGETHLALGNSVKAANLFERFLTESGADANPALREAAEGRRLTLSKTLGAMTVRCPTAGAAIFIDDEPLGTLPVDRFFYLEPGVYRLKVAKVGFVTHTERIKLRAGDWQSFEVTLVLRALPGLPPPEPPARVARASSPPAGSVKADPEGNDSVTDKWWFWLIVVGGVGLAAGATALVIDAAQFQPADGTLGTTSTDDWERR